MTPKEVRVIYKAPGVIKELDQEIVDLLKRWGFQRWASGYSFDEQERDLAFDKVDS